MMGDVLSITTKLVMELSPLLSPLIIWLTEMISFDHFFHFLGSTVHTTHSISVLVIIIVLTCVL